MSFLLSLQLFQEFLTISSSPTFHRPLSQGIKTRLISTNHIYLGIICQRNHLSWFLFLHSSQYSAIKNAIQAEGPIRWSARGRCSSSARVPRASVPLQRDQVQALPYQGLFLQSCPIILPASELSLQPFGQPVKQEDNWGGGGYNNWYGDSEHTEESLCHC